MELFEEYIETLRHFIAHDPSHKTIAVCEPVAWPRGGDRNLVLAGDMGLELGHPQMKSVSSIMWTDKPNLVHDRRITLIGPDIPASSGRSLAFGKVVLVAGQGFNAENTYDRYREMEGTRYELDLRGYMLRAVSQYQREWCRVSKAALQGGLSFRTIGSRHMDLLQRLPFVSAAEILFVTSNTAAVRQLQQITAPAARIVGAMNKMVDDMDFDCESCEYLDVCTEAGALKDMHARLMQSRTENPTGNPTPS